MKHHALVIGALTLFCVESALASSRAPDAERDLLDLSLEDLMDMEVVTSSKSEEKVGRSASVMSVITAKDIERAGYRTLYEALARVPGFFPSTQATWPLVGSRGLQADGNDHILLLIDGHRQNSILSHGYQQQDMLPNLDRVERIEVIRGPGSVMWGTSAAYAVINVITRDSVADGKATQVRMGYGSADGMFSTSVMQNLNIGNDVRGFISATRWESKGYGVNGTPNIKFPWGSDTNFVPNIDAQDPGFDIYSKLKIGSDQQLIARFAQSSTTYLWDSWGYDPDSDDVDARLRPGAELRMRKAYLSYSKNQSLTQDLTVNFNGYGDLLTQNRFPKEASRGTGGDNTRWVEDMSREELAFGGEAVANYQMTDWNQLKFGVQYVHTIVGPNRGFRLDTSTGLPTVPEGSEVQVPLIDIPSGRDNNVGIFLEDRVSFNDGKTDVFAGARADWNDWRERKAVLLPRAGLIHSFSDLFTTKYVYNTGYLRPNAAYSKSGGKFFRAGSKTIHDINVVSQSERVASHDMQFQFSGNRNHFIATAFYMSISDFISWETKHDLGYRNMGDARSYGLELEGRYFIFDSFAMNGNYSFARGRLNEVPIGVNVNGTSERLVGAVTDGSGDWLNYPRHMWNLGFDYLPFNRHSLNFNVRGWHDMIIVGPYNSPRAGEFDRLKGELYLDLSYAAKDIIANFDVNVFVMNLLDNTEPVGMVINNGVFHPRGRNFGLQLSKRF